jgi:hypothetical protein
MSLRTKFFKELRKLDLPVGAAPLPVVTETDLSSLPQAAQRYLRFMGVVGRPRDWSFRTGFVGRFKVKQSAPWRPCDVWQYNTSPVVTRCDCSSGFWSRALAITSPRCADEDVQLV